MSSVAHRVTRGLGEKCVKTDHLVSSRPGLFLALSRLACPLTHVNSVSGIKERRGWGVGISLSERCKQNKCLIGNRGRLAPGSFCVAPDPGLFPEREPSFWSMVECQTLVNYLGTRLSSLRKVAVPASVWRSFLGNARAWLPSAWLLI